MLYITKPVKVKFAIIQPKALLIKIKAVKHTNGNSISILGNNENDCYLLFS